MVFCFYTDILKSIPEKSVLNLEFLDGFSISLWCIRTLKKLCVVNETSTLVFSVLSLCKTKLQINNLIKQVAKVCVLEMDQSRSITGASSSTLGENRPMELLCMP